MANKKITDLPEASSITSNDYIVIDNGVASKKAKATVISDLAGTETDAKLASYYTKTAADALLAAKQDNLTAGHGIAIASNVISESFLAIAENHNRIFRGEEITRYVTDGSLWNRIAGTNGFTPFEDIYLGDYIKMSRAITAPNIDSGSSGVTGSQYVMVAGINTLYGNGDSNAVTYPHLVMVPGQGKGGTQHFGQHRMNATNTTVGGYKGSVMNTSVIGSVVSSGSTASGATINQQLYAEFGSHLKTVRELISNDINATGYNRFGTNSGCANNWGWASFQAILLTEVEAYGSIAWSSSGYDIGSGKVQLPAFALCTQALNNRSAWWWLRAVASATDFCYCSNRGTANYYNASNTSYYVRPRFVLA